MWKEVSEKIHTKYKVPLVYPFESTWPIFLVAFFQNLMMYDSDSLWIEIAFYLDERDKKDFKKLSVKKD